MHLIINDITIEAKFLVLDILRSECKRIKKTINHWKHKQETTNEGLSQIGWDILKDKYTGLRKEYCRLYRYLYENHLQQLKKFEAENDH